MKRYIDETGTIYTEEQLREHYEQDNEGHDSFDDYMAAALKWDCTLREIPNAGSKGSYLDRLRTKYPYRIRRAFEPQYEATLRAIQPLLEGREIPIYRFPGGECIEDPFSPGIEVLEW